MEQFLSSKLVSEAEEATKVRTHGHIINWLIACCLCCCAKDKGRTPIGISAEAKHYCLSIANGPSAVEQCAALTFSAHLLKENGEEIPSVVVEWRSDPGSMVGSVFSYSAAAVGVVTATAVYSGATYTACVPINVIGRPGTIMFTGAPAAVSAFVGNASAQLLAIYPGPGNAIFSFRSENTSVCTVSDAGVLKFHTPGYANVVVSMELYGMVSSIKVPVVVSDPPVMDLPIARIELAASAFELFVGESTTMVAKAFDSHGKEVREAKFRYDILSRTQNGVTGNIASIDSAGRLTALSYGSASIRVRSGGMTSIADVVVNPDTIIDLSMHTATIGGLDYSTNQVRPKSALFCVTSYLIDRVAYRAGLRPCHKEIGQRKVDWQEIQSSYPVVDRCPFNNSKSRYCYSASPQFPFTSTVVARYQGSWSMGVVNTAN